MSEPSSITGCCEICCHCTANVQKYGDWSCEKCNQEYSYDEGHAIVLTDKQREILRKAYEMGDQR